MSNSFLVEVSARHIHLDAETLEILFGKDYELTIKRRLSMPTEYVCEERLDVIGPKRTISNVSILGPLRSKTQVEVSLTDCYTLGQVAPVRLSGDIANSPSIRLKGPAGEVEIKEGLIVAKRHIHMNPEDAERLGVKDQEVVCVEVETARPVIFCDTIVRVRDDFSLSMHIDTDEANAALIGRAGCEGRIVKK
jgi:putative phosphotransacetylase